MTGDRVFRVYLAERPDGQRYVGCSKRDPEDRLRDTYHPIRWVAPGRKPWPREEIEITVLFHSTSPVEAAKYETEMIGELRTLHPHGKNGRLESGYPRVPVNP